MSALAAKWSNAGVKVQLCGVTAKVNEIYPMWVVAHGIMIVTPMNWFKHQDRSRR
jgi:multimeric flavodoxin WrbA